MGLFLVTPSHTRGSGLSLSATVVVLLQPLVFVLQPHKAAPIVPHAPTSRGRLCCRGGLTAPTIPTVGQALQRRQPHTTLEPVNPRTPLRAGLHCRVVPFLGLTVVHRCGALRAAWSTWSRNDFHRKSTVCGEADSWVHSRSKEVPPYYAQNNYSST